MSSESIMTEYGKICSKFSRNKLVDLCVEEAGVQTGPFGSQLHSEDYVEIGTPIITVEHLGDNRILHENTPCVSEDDKARLSKYHLKAGDIVFSRVGSVDRRALVRDSEDGWLFSGRCLRVRVDRQKIDPAFLSYFFGYEGFKTYIRSVAVGATMPSINTKILSDVPIYYPPLSEQKKIAEILYALDEKIELNRQINQTLEQIAQAIFTSWFVDFDPVIAKIEAKENGQDPERAAMRAISGKTEEQLDAWLTSATSKQIQQLITTAALFPDSLQESELGEIPESWEVKALGELCARIAMGPFGSDIKTSNFVPEGVPIIRGGNLTAGFVDDNFVFLTETKADELRNANARAGDIVITHRGTLGQVGLIPRDSRYPRYVVSQSQMVLTVKKERVTSRCIYEFLRSSTGQQALLANMSQVGVPAIARPTASVRAITLLTPPLKLLHAFDSVVDPLFGHVHGAVCESSMLAVLRDTLLPRFLAGKIEIHKESNKEVA